MSLYGSLPGGYAAARSLTTDCCLTESRRSEDAHHFVAADDCIGSTDFCACNLLLDHSTGADHRSRAFQITPSVALSLSLSLCVLPHWLFTTLRTHLRSAHKGSDILCYRQ